jgi:phosphoglycerate dehydrogenase-like enzyme
MTKIALLQGMDTTNSVFSKQDLEEIAEMGTVVVNSVSGKPKPSQVAEWIEGADIAVTSWGCPALDSRILDQAPNLKLVVHAAGTVKGVVTNELIARGIRMSSANDALGQGVAETALGLAIVSLKGIWPLRDNTRKGLWSEGKENIRELYGIHIGIIGAGKAGQHLIRLLSQFDVHILVYDPVCTDEQVRAMGAERVSLEYLLQQSDVVSIHAPSIPATYKMINGPRLKLMKDDAILINTARGNIVDEQALAEELGSGRLWACIDVTDPEPPAKDHPFRTLPNVILTPHIAGLTGNGRRRIGKYAVQELKRYLSGQPMQGEVDLRHLDILA